MCFKKRSANMGMYIDIGKLCIQLKCARSSGFKAAPKYLPSKKSVDDSSSVTQLPDANTSLIVTLIWKLGKYIAQ